jgi:hypothetical protein
MMTATLPPIETKSLSCSVFGLAPLIDGENHVGLFERTVVVGGEFLDIGIVAHHVDRDTLNVLVLENFFVAIFHGAVGCVDDGLLDGASALENVPVGHENPVTLATLGLDVGTQPLAKHKDVVRNSKFLHNSVSPLGLCHQVGKFNGASFNDPNIPKALSVQEHGQHWNTDSRL